MKVCLTKYSCGNCIMHTYDRLNYITYLFDPIRYKSLYIQSYGNLRPTSELVSHRIVTIKTKSSSKKVTVACSLSSEYEQSLRCVISTDSEKLQFRQGLHFVQRIQG
jgi:hypothetical protein